MNLTDDQCDEFRRLPGSFNTMVRAIYEAGRLAAQVETPTKTNPYEEAVIDQLTATHIYNETHDHDARKALNDLLAFHVGVALDPQVSSDAAALVESGRQIVIRAVTNPNNQPSQYGTILMPEETCRQFDKIVAGDDVCGCAPGDCKRAGIALIQGG